MSNWKNFNAGDLIPAQVTTTLGAVSQGVGALISVLQVLLNLLQTLQGLNLALDNPLSALIGALLQQVTSLLADLQDAGVYFLPLFPQSQDEITLYQGGYARYRQLFLSSLYDVNDLDRPQFSANSFVGGLFIYVNGDTPATFLNTLQQFRPLLRDTPFVKYPAPINVTLEAADDQGIVPGSFFDLFASGANTTLSTLKLTFDEPRLQGQVLQIYQDQRFYVEKSTLRLGQDLEELIYDPDTGARVEYWEPLNDANPGESFFKIGTAQGIAQGAFIGRYSVIIKNVQPGQDNARYYRIQAVPDDVQPVLTQGRWGLQQKGLPYTGSEPSAPVLGVIPNVNTSAFNVAQALWDLYRLAYLYRLDATINPLGQDSQAYLNPPIPESISAELNRVGALAINFFEGQLIKTAEEGSLSQSRTRALTAQTASLLSLDPYAGQSEFFEDLSQLEVSEKLLSFIDGAVYEKVLTLTDRLSRNDTLRETFIQVWLTIAAQATNAVYQNFTVVPLDNTLYQTVLTLIGLLESQVIPGDPPNWSNIQILKDLTPPLDDLLTQVSGLVAGLASFTLDGSDKLDLGADILAEAISGISDILAGLDALIALLQGLDFSFNVLFIPPTQRGTQGLVNAFLQAQNSPPTNTTAYGGGFALVFGGPDAAALNTTASTLRLLFDF